MGSESKASGSSDRVVSDRRAAAVVAAVLVLALGWTYRVYWGHDPSEQAPAFSAPAVTKRAGGPARAIQGGVAVIDHHLTAWLIARNARTWLRGPWRLFDGEICHPTTRSIAYGEPAFTLGLIGVPAWLATGDPLLTYNFVLIVLTVGSALAMFLLVRAWTGQVAAALVAALLYGFHWVKVMDPVHLYVSDTVWTVLALYFFRRWLEAGGWRDCLLLLLACTLQIGGSLYPLIGAAIVGSAFAVWGALRIGLRHTRPAQWLVLVAGLALVLAAMFGPYLAVTAEGGMSERPVQVFLAWSDILPGGRRSLGLLLPLLCMAALLPERRGERGERGEQGAPSPRWALLIASVVILLLATGGNQAARMLAEATGETPPPALPNLYAWLAAVVPGLDVVRVPATIATGAHLGLSLLAGLGAASLLRRVPAARTNAASLGLVALTLVDVLRPGLPGPLHLEMQPLAPGEDRLAFYRALEQKGNRGPLLELPTGRRVLFLQAQAVLLSAYHHRRTSACGVNSFLSQASERVVALAAAVPDADALSELAAMGFTTVVVHHEPGKRGRERLSERIRQASAQEGGTLRAIHETPSLSAYEIVVD